MDHFAVIETGGKQYKVQAGDKLKVEKLEAAVGGEISFDKVLLLVKGDQAEIGKPYVKDASVKAKVSSAGRHEKKIIFRFHSKTRYRKLKGARQHYTEVSIDEINP